MFTYHEFSLTDAVGHDYGPHHDALHDALVETDKRIGKILSVLDRRGLFESTLFVISADHGMAQTDVELAADPAQAVIDAGLKAVVTSPLIYLLDMDVTLEPSADGRTVNVTVLENDADARTKSRRSKGRTCRWLARADMLSLKLKPTTSESPACRFRWARSPNRWLCGSNTSASTLATCDWMGRT